jgi:uncharacterized protein
MSVFREHKTVADRSASDRRRHKKKIEKAIKDGIHSIVAEESIIGKDGKKKIRIPVRGIKEYRFVYGDNSNNGKVGSAPGKDIRRGQKIGKGKKEKGPGKGSKPGDEAGTEYYDVEITLEELADYLFADLELPDLERKSLKKIMSEKFRRKGYRKQGITPRLDKKKTAINRIRRKKAASKREGFDEEQKFSFHEEDMSYRHYKKTNKENSNAVIFFLMDISGSMTTKKKFIARSFYFLLYHFIRSKYNHTEIVFVSHDTAAYEVGEDQFFTRGNSGGTKVSAGLLMVDNIIHQRYHPSAWNIYCFQCSDGDNWPDDTPKTIELMEKIKSVAQLVGYCEIDTNPDTETKWFVDSKLSLVYKPLVDKKFKMAEVTGKEDVWPAFNKFFSKRIKVRS